jgi:ATP-dependent helicase HepA
MNNIFEHFGVEYEELEERIYFVSPSDLMYIDNFPFLPLDGTTLTYDRKSALERDEVTFITNEHPMVSGVIDLLLGSEQGNSAIILFEDAEDSTIILEAVYVLETLAPKELQINRFLPPTPIKTFINQELKVPDYDLYEVMKYGTDLSPDDVFIKPEITKLVKLMLEKTKELAKVEAQGIVTDKLEKMHNILDYEKSRLVELKKVNPNITEKEITFLHDKIGLLDTNIKDYRLRLDSLRLICSDPEDW